MTPDQQKKFDTLQRKLRELFMLDFPELDFGIYRIMNHKRREIEQFLAQDLLPQVRTILAENQSTDAETTRRELENLEKTLQSAGVDPNGNAKVLELRGTLAHDDPDALAPEVYFHLTTFFSRYYDSGDFISQRRYKNDVYAIPYQGEEVKLHWANHDQYYIKTAEYFKTYRFRLDDQRLVTFALADATTDQNNNKSSDKRAFALTDADFLDATIPGDLTLTFTYLPTKTKQTELNKEAIERIRTALADPALHAWLDLVLPGKAPTAANAQRSLLEKHLTDYTARNTFDYFIHKDLGAFLHRELDFYIKNEILFLDDIGSRAADEFVRQIGKIKAIKAVGDKIIAFLAQLENFQKKLWLKKKFVTDTHYCITLDRIPTDLYPDIAANADQTEEWVRLFRIDLISSGPAADLLSQPITGFSRPLTVQFLHENPFLLVDTAFFPEAFKIRLLAQFHDLDEQTDGLLIHSENFQALSLLQERYREEVKCVYIDPPYNTAASEILYKNEYKNSSWMTLIHDRIALTKPLLTETGILCATIDDCQQKELHSLLEAAFVEGGLAGTVVIRCNPSGRPTQTGFALAHEYGIFARNTEKGIIQRMERSEEQMDRFDQTDEDGVFELRNLRREGSNSERERRKRLYYPIFITENSLRIPMMKWDEDDENWIVKENPNNNEQIIIPIDDNGIERTWRWSHEKVLSDPSQVVVKKVKGKFGVYCKYRPNEEGAVTPTIWSDPKYSATEHGTALLKKMFASPTFSYPKSIFAVEDSLAIMGLRKPVGIALDYFAGSGTTAHAVLNFNREDGGRRKYILVEMGEYFDAVTKPRVLKAAYSKDWAGGVPVSRAGMSHCMKYVRLESYEDTLNNLLPIAPETGLWQGAPAAREEYLLHYLLDFETQGQHLDLARFRKPFDYRLRITRRHETREQSIDLVETFNYLIGLRVAHRWQPRPGICLLRGHTRADERTLVIWRDCDTWDNAALNAFLEKSDINPRDGEFDRIYVNGDNNVENLKTGDERWKVALTEEAFLQRMFENS